MKRQYLVASYWNINVTSSEKTAPLMHRLSVWNAQNKYKQSYTTIDNSRCYYSQHDMEVAIVFSFLDTILEQGWECRVGLDFFLWELIVESLWFANAVMFQKVGVFIFIKNYRAHEYCKAFNAIFHLKKKSSEWHFVQKKIKKIFCCHCILSMTFFCISDIKKLTDFVA